MRDYFQFYGVPDLWIMSAPFQHGNGMIINMAKT